MRRKVGIGDECQGGGRRSSDLVLTCTGTEKGTGALFCTCVHGSVCVIGECVCIDTRLNP